MKGMKSKDCIIYNVNEKINVPVLIPPNSREHSKQNLSKLYKFIAGWLLSNNIYQVAGPVCSGAVMSYAISVVSDGQIKATFLPKCSDKYTPRVHTEGSLMSFSYVIVDDIIETGMEMRNSIRIANKQTSLNPRAILCFESSSYFTHEEVPIFRAAFIKME